MVSYGGDTVSLPGQVAAAGSDCPTGVVLAPGEIVRWQSDSFDQGTVGSAYQHNGCDANGLCGLPHSSGGLGGGWQICFQR